MLRFCIPYIYRHLIDKVLIMLKSIFYCDSYYFLSDITKIEKIQFKISICVYEIKLR